MSMQTLRQREALRRWAQKRSKVEGEELDFDPEYEPHHERPTDDDQYDIRGQRQKPRYNDAGEHNY